jgi:lipoprotein-anchoring transpeptidase ErfK/SrfK
MTSRYRIGFLGSWALFVIAGGLAALAAFGEWANWKDAARINRLEKIDAIIGSRVGGKIERLREVSDEREEKLEKLRSQVEQVKLDLDDSRDTEQTIIVSTAENRLRVRRRGVVVFEAICSTGKGTTLEIEGRKMVFDTPTGSFRVQSKEENPVWVPPDWHFVEEARKKHLEVVRIAPGQAIDAETGNPVPAQPSSGIWSWLSSRDRPRRILKVRQNTVVEVASDGSERELPQGELIRAGKAIVVPPPGTLQRRFEKTLGHYRLNIGSGYGIHGTTATNQLGRSASHGCVRLSDADLERLFKMVKVGDQVLIY